MEREIGIRLVTIIRPYVSHSCCRISIHSSSQIETCTRIIGCSTKLNRVFVTHWINLTACSLCSKLLHPAVSVAEFDVSGCLAGTIQWRDAGTTATLLHSLYADKSPAAVLVAWLILLSVISKGCWWRLEFYVGQFKVISHYTEMTETQRVEFSPAGTCWRKRLRPNRAEQGDVCNTVPVSVCISWKLVVRGMCCTSSLWKASPSLVSSCSEGRNSMSQYCLLIGLQGHCLSGAYATVRCIVVTQYADQTCVSCISKI